MGSSPVISFSSDSARCCPSSASVAETNRAPFKTATSLLRSSPCCFTISVGALVVIAYSPSIRRIALMKVVLPFRPSPYRNHMHCSDIRSLKQ